MMLAVASPGMHAPPSLRQGWGALASIAAHGLILMLLLNASASRSLRSSDLHSIEVDLVSPAQFAALRQPAPATPALPMPPASAAPVGPAPPAPAATGTQAGSIRATSFYAAALLSEPASAGLRRSLAQTEPRERLVQLCGIEALEQIRRARPEYDPDIVVAYAFAETRLSAGTLLATGAAFRSRREWYHASFSCAATADLSAVADFSIFIGEFVPHEEWDDHYLTAEEIGD